MSNWESSSVLPEKESKYQLIIRKRQDVEPQDGGTGPNASGYCSQLAQEVTRASLLEGKLNKFTSALQVLTAQVEGNSKRKLRTKRPR